MKMAALQLTQFHAPPRSNHRSHSKAHLFTSSRPAKPLRITAASSGNTGGRQLVLEGKVRAVEPKEATAAVDSEGYLLLDVRPVWEREKARVKGSLHVPLFVEDTDNSPITLLKKWVHFGYIGLWTGQKFTTYNGQFVRQVENLVPGKQSKLLVACGEGLRSLMAVSKLYKEGYRSLGWLAGGFNRTAEDDFEEIEGGEKLQYATIGGASYYFLKLLILLQALGQSSKES